MEDNWDVRSKTAIVTGASNGIGKCVVFQLTGW